MGELLFPRHFTLLSRGRAPTEIPTGYLRAQVLTKYLLLGRAGIHLVGSRLWPVINKLHPAWLASRHDGFDNVHSLQ